MIPFLVFKNAPRNQRRRFATGGNHRNQPRDLRDVVLGYGLGAHLTIMDFNFRKLDEHYEKMFALTDLDVSPQLVAMDLSPAKFVNKFLNSDTLGAFVPSLEDYYECKRSQMTLCSSTMTTQEEVLKPFYGTYNISTRTANVVAYTLRISDGGAVGALLVIPIDHQQLADITARVQLARENGTAITFRMPNVTLDTYKSDLTLALPLRHTLTFL